jgi:hypothetical protein
LRIGKFDIFNHDGFQAAQGKYIVNYHCLVRSAFNILGEKSAHINVHDIDSIKPEKIVKFPDTINRAVFM